MSALIAGNEIDVAKFDLDGTMVGYLPTVIDVGRKLLMAHLAQHGRIVDLDIELFRGGPVLHAFRDVLHTHDMPAADAMLEQLFWRHHDEVNRRLETEGLLPTPELVPLLYDLRDSSLNLCVISSNTHARIDLCLKLAGIDRFFPRANRYSSYGPHIEGHKPHPAIYRHAIASQNADPSRCVAVEDSVSGVQAAVAAGIAVVIGYTGDYTPGEREQAADELSRVGASCVIKHWNEFPLYETQRIRAAKKVGSI